MLGIFYLFGPVLAALSGAVATPSLVAPAHQEDELVPFFRLSPALLPLLAGGLPFALRGTERRLKRYEALVLCVMLWTLVPLFAAVPLYLSSHLATPFDAYFESVSGFTTTGVTLLNAMETVPRALLFWRGMLEWLGGAATLLMLLLVFAPAHIGGTPDRPLRSVETGARTSRMRIIGTAGRVLPLYAGLTGMCFLMLAAAGLSPLQSVGLAFSAVSTGGFNVTGQSLENQSIFAQVVVTLFMFVGATSIVWQRALATPRWPAARQHRGGYWLPPSILVLPPLFSYGFYKGPADSVGLQPADAVWTGLVSAVSIISTTGIEVREGGFAALALPLLLVLVLVGGGGFSTAGGIRLFRIGAMALQAKRELNRLVHPHGVRSARIGSQDYDLQMLKAVWVSFLAFVAAVSIGTLGLAVAGVSFEASLIAIVANLANAGAIYTGLGASVPFWISYAEMGTGAQAILVLMMIVGRMEVLGVLALFNLYFWRS